MSCFYNIKSLELIILLSLQFAWMTLHAQIDNDGCVGAGFGVDADVYTDLLQFGDQGGAAAAGTYDWFTNGAGTQGTIDETDAATIQALLLGGGNPLYEARMANKLSSIINGQILIDALWAREHFGGTGYTDQTSYSTASKNGEDPAIWDPGPANVLGKNDLIDVAGHMRRDGITLNDDLWFFGTIVRAEPGGSAYMDFEFFVEEVFYVAGSGFTSGGPDLGHTAFAFDAGGNITGMGDIIFNCALINGGEVPNVEMRLWVSKTDYNNLTPANFAWGPEYDGAFNNSPFGYASIIPNNGNDACGIVNLDNENPSTPPWGAVGTKSNAYITTYDDFSFFEVGVNLSGFGIDNSTILGADPCDFPLKTFIIKTRASASFTAQLKDYAGPYGWGQPSSDSDVVGDSLLSCITPEIILTVEPFRTDATYLWSTIDGNIIGDVTNDTITVDQPGTYTVTTTLPTGCPVNDAGTTITFDPTKPFFEDPTFTTTVSCSGSDGTIDLTVAGGTSPYTYNWSNGATTEDLTGLAGGTYTVTITDNIACTITGSATVDARVPTNITSTQTNIDCNGNTIGAIDITVTGQSPFTYNWSNGATSEDLTNLTAGTYTVTVTDADNCTEILAVTITEPAALSLSGITTDETDSALDDGTIDLTVSGGTTAYTYLWSTTATTEDISGLAAGTYIVTVTDANGCIDSLSFIIYEPEICNDGIDNDGDGLSDCSDSDCTPTTPGTITPSNLTPCVGDVGITYTIAAVAAVTVYQWAVPTGATITAGQGTTIITVSWTGTQGGQICVQSDNVGCLSASSCITVSPDDVPAAPGSIIISN